MITGKGSGSGKYSYQETTRGAWSVMVSHLPEDSYSVRIIFRHMGETNIPIMKMGINEGELLWSSFNKMAKDLNWDDRMFHEINESLKK